MAGEYPATDLNRPPMTTATGRAPDGPGLTEVFAVWLLFGGVAVILVTTYTRTPPAALYSVSHSGLRGGAGRLLVFVNFPTALAAVALTGVAAAHWRSGRGAATSGWTRGLRLASLVGVVLCFVIAKPGVVDESNLDAQPVNALAATGVILALGLTLVTARVFGRGQPSSFTQGDRARLAFGAVLSLVALPWLFAEAGVYIGRVPLLGSLFMSEQVAPGETEAAVHLGHHHGTAGLYLALTALLLSRVLGRIAPGRLRGALTFYLSLMLVYGVGNMANDFWTEQVWKRGWTAIKLPSVLQLALTPAWVALVLAAIVVHVRFFRPASTPPPTLGAGPGVPGLGQVGSGS